MEKFGFIMNKKELINTMDFNFMSVLSHTVHENLWLATELIFEYLDE